MANGFVPEAPNEKPNEGAPAAGVVAAPGVTVVPANENPVDGAVLAGGLDSREGLPSSIMDSSWGGGVACLVGDGEGAAAGAPKVKVPVKGEAGVLVVVAGAKGFGLSVLAAAVLPKENVASFLAGLLNEKEGAPGVDELEIPTPAKGLGLAASGAGVEAAGVAAGVEPKEKMGGGAVVTAGAVTSAVVEVVADFPNEKIGGVAATNGVDAFESPKEKETAGWGVGVGAGWAGSICDAPKRLALAAAGNGDGEGAVDRPGSDGVVESAFWGAGVATGVGAGADGAANENAGGFGASPVLPPKSENAGFGAGTALGAAGGLKEKRGAELATGAAGFGWAAKENGRPETGPFATFGAMSTSALSC